MGFSALDWFYSTYYPVGTVHLAPIKLYPIYNTSSALPDMLFQVYPTSLTSPVYVRDYNTNALVEYTSLPGFGGANLSGDPTHAKIQVSFSDSPDPTKLLDKSGNSLDYTAYHAWLYSGENLVDDATMSFTSKNTNFVKNPRYLGYASCTFTDIDLTAYPVDQVVITLEESSEPQEPGFKCYEGTIGGTFSVIRFEGQETVQSGTLEDIYRVKDQWGNDWITSIKVSGKVYEVLFPGRGEFPAIAASITGTKEEPTAPVGQVGAVESGATFFSEADEEWYGEELVFNNLWDEREIWLGQPVEFTLSRDGKVRCMWMGSAAAAAAFLEYGMVTRVNMLNDASGYHLSIDVMKPDGTVVNYPLTELVDTDGVTKIFWNFSWYNEHNRGSKTVENGKAALTDYTSLYAEWQSLQNLVRDLVKLTKVTTALGDILRIQELSTNHGQWQEYNTEGIIDEIGPTFDGTIFSLENTSREQLSWFFRASDFYPNATPGDVNTTWLAAKDMITVPWSSGMTLQPGTAIYDATLPAPNVPTPDGNILIKKMADLQREQFVQVFFQPVEEPANPTMCDWMLVNGEYIPVVKFIVIRPMLGTELRILDSGLENVEYDDGPPVPLKDFYVYMQFNEPLNTSKSWMALYNVDEGQWFPWDGDCPFCGELSFTQIGLYPNDTMIFTPCGLVPGHYIVFYNAVDADTGTEVLAGTWEFDLGGTLGEWSFEGTVTSTGDFAQPLEGVTVVLEYYDACGVFHIEETTTDSAGVYVFDELAFCNYLDGTIYLDGESLFDVVNAIQPSVLVIVEPEDYSVEVTPWGDSVSGLDFLVTVD
jgi:hypothetical protein